MSAGGGGHVTERDLGAAAQIALFGARRAGGWLRAGAAPNVTCKSFPFLFTVIIDLLFTAVSITCHIGLHQLCLL